MKYATLKQANKILDLAKNVPCEQVQKVIASGLLSDLLNADVDMIDRVAFRRFVGLKKLPVPATRKAKGRVCDSCGNFMAKIEDRYQCLNFRCERHCVDFFGGCKFYAGDSRIFGYTGICERCRSMDPKGGSMIS